MLQRSNVTAMSAATGELGKYVNRLGWAVSSEEQRLAALGRIKEYAISKGNIELEKLVTGLEAATSLVFNPEGAIDAAVGASMKINLNATNQSLLMAFNLTRDGGFSDEVAQRALSNSLFSLMGDDSAIREIATRAGIMTSGAYDVSALTMETPEMVNLVNTILARNDKFSEELIGIINLSSDNVGTTLVNNTAKQMGMIRALQEFYPDIDFSGIGMVGFDDFATHLKLSDIASKTDDGDVNRVIESIVEGGNKVAKALGIDLPESSIIKKIDGMTRPGKKFQNKKVSGAEAKVKLLELFGLEGEAKENFATKNIDDIMANVNASIAKMTKDFGTMKYNQYAPGGLATIYETIPLNEAMGELKGTITQRLGNAAGSYGKTIDDLMIEGNLLRDLENMTFNGNTLRNRRDVTDKLINRGLATEEELNDLVTKGARKAMEGKRTATIGILRVSNDFAEQEARNAVQEFFTAHIQKYQNELRPDGSKFNRVEEVMDKLLFEIEEMKNARRILKPTAIEDGLTAMGFMLENVLSSAEPIEIAAPGIEKFTVQQLAAFVRINHTLQVTKFTGAQKQTDDIVNLIEALVSKNADADLTVPNNLMDKDFLSRLFKVDRQSAKNAEIDMLERVPKLVNPEEVQQILNGMTDSSVDLEFLEDFLAFNGEDLDPTGGVIGQRIRAAASSTETETEIAEKVSNRVRLIGTMRTRYEAMLETQLPEYAQFNAILQGGEEIAPGIFTPSLRGDATERSLGTIEDAIEAMRNKFIREAEDDADRAVRATLARTYADPGVTASGKYTRIQDFMKSPQMRELYEGALKNKGKIAGVAAIATGLAVFGSIKKKERTQEAMSGPPLLPGGNPYERIPNSPMGFSDAPISQNGQGMSYNISVDGDQDNMEQFMNRARISNKWECSRYYA
jgi:hypothetical protein